MIKRPNTTHMGPHGEQIAVPGSSLTLGPNPKGPWRDQRGASPHNSPQEFSRALLQTSLSSVGVGWPVSLDERWRGQRGLWRMLPAFVDAASDTLNADEV